MPVTPRRILFINYEYPPVGAGGGNATRHIAREMARAGHQPYVLTAAQGDLPRVENDGGVTVRRIAALRQRRDRSSVPEMAAFMGAAMLAAPGLARQWKIDAVIAFFTLPSGPAAWLLKRTNRLPYVIALRGGDVPGFDPATMKGYHTLTGPVISALWRDADAVIANSEGLAEMARRHDQRRTIGVIPQGADVAGIAPKTEYPLRTTVELLAVGRLAKHKALEVLLEALSRLPGEPAWRLTIVGDGPERADLAARAARLNISARVVFRGWVGRDALPPIYRAADIFVLPSREEGMANVLMEAMSAGLPVIATRIAGSSEGVIDGETGLLAPPDDAQHLAGALETMIGDAARREAFGRAGRARVERAYAWPIIAEAWLDMVDRILQNKHT
jgi:glycogen(starch) synthase